MIDLIEELNELQKEAVEHFEGPLLVIAGAGSGKTRVITYRIASMLGNGIMPKNILAVTFTNKAAEEMKMRIKRLSPRVKIDSYNNHISDSDLWIGTFHSICAKILRRNIQEIGFKNNFIIYDSYDQKVLIKTCMKELSLSEKQNNPNHIHAAISAAKNKLLDPQQYSEYIGSYFERIVLKVYESYQRKLFENNALDFDDLIMHTVRLFKEKKEILASYQDRFHYVLVDEYQDTNHMQYHLINLLSLQHNNICVVGDPDQSIYRWRGADIRNILEFEDDYEAVKVIRLEQNYRSTQMILEASNNVIKNNSRRTEKQLWTHNKEGDKLVYFEGENESQEIDFIIDAIEDCTRKSDKKHSDMVVFYRVHAQSRGIEEGLRRAGIPYDIVGGISFYERKEIKDILAYLRVIYFPLDEVSLKRIINIPHRGIGDSTIEKIQEFSRNHNCTFYDALIRVNENNTLSERAKNRITIFVDLLKMLKVGAVDKNVPEIIELVLEKTQYIESLKKEDAIQSQARIENVKEIISAAQEYMLEYSDATLEDFLEGISLLSNIDIWNEEQEKITLMTVHSAKGLEFDVVFMIGMEEGLFPHMNSFNELEELQEERRLCYVGMTRAREKLHITSVKSRMIYGRRNCAIPSRFINEIPSEYIDKVGLYGDATQEEPFVEYRSKDKDEQCIEYSKGQMVLHPKFGIGKILDLDGTGSQSKLRILFDNNPSPKWLLVRYARLTLLDY
ncbi:ATP-dependent helicase [Chlamydiota bacterium]